MLQEAYFVRKYKVVAEGETARTHAFRTLTDNTQSHTVMLLFWRGDFPRGRLNNTVRSVDAPVKAFAKTALIAGIAFGIPMGMFAGVVIVYVRGFSAGILAGLVIAALSSLTFGFAMTGFMAMQRRRSALARPEFAGEHLLHDGPANHFLNGEGVGGWLFLTKERLYFRSHEVNIQRHELSIPLAEIAEVHAVRTVGIFPNGLRLATCAGRNERFVVEANQRWRDEIIRAQK